MHPTLSNILKHSITVPVFPTSLSLKKQTNRYRNCYLPKNCQPVLLRLGCTIYYQNPSEHIQWYTLSIWNPYGLYSKVQERCKSTIHKPGITQENKTYQPISAFLNQEHSEVYWLNLSPQIFDSKPRIMWCNVSPVSSSCLGLNCLLYLGSSRSLEHTITGHLFLIKLHICLTLIVWQIFNPSLIWALVYIRAIRFERSHSG